MLARIRDRKDQEGFTLIELLVVMIIIGILAAIAIPIFLNQRKAAHDSAVKSDLRSAATQVESFFVNNDAYPPSNADLKTNTTLAVKTSTGVTLNYTARTTSKTFCIVGTHADASHVWVYDSNNGGLQPGTTLTCPA